MKRASHLFEKIISDNNLELAIKEVCKSHRWIHYPNKPNKTTVWMESTIDKRVKELRKIFAAQTANTAALTGIQAQIAQNSNAATAGIADLKYTVATENCADRTAAAQNTRDIIEAQTNGTRAILDKLCQLELDGVKAQVDAKNDRISELQTQLNMASLRESQTAQNAFIQQGFANEVDQLYNRLNNCPVPSTPVYGRTPIFTCGGNGTGCGCGYAA